MTCWFAGGYREARGHLERALALFEPGRDDDLTFRFAWDPGVAAMASLAIVSWLSGRSIARFRSWIACRRGSQASRCRHACSWTNARGHVRIDAWRPPARRAERIRACSSRARARSEPVARVWSVSAGWAASQSGALADGLEDMRRGAALLREQNALLYDGLLKVALAGAEAGRAT